MAAPNPHTTTPGEGIDNEEIISSDTGDSSELYNDDEILNVNPDENRRKTAGGPGHYVKNDDDITPGFNDEPGAEPGLTRGETTMGSDLPSEQAEDDVKIDCDPRQSYVNSINIAISSLQKEIYKSEQERKSSSVIIERQFAEIIEVLCNKKFELIQKMNEFYDDQKDQSMDRILELKNELSEKELEMQIEREKERQRQELIAQEEEEKAQAAAELAAKRAAEKEDDTPMTTSKRLSIFGSKLKENALKAKNMAGKYIEEWMADKNGPSVAEQAKYDKHHKVRLFVPKKELAKLIEADIRLSTEWWDPFRMNHIVYNTYDAELWRTSAISSGWFNAFGSIKVRKSQTKRWNIKIVDRVKKPRGITKKKQPADVVLGVIESSKARSQDKAAGFWSKGWDGFGLYGWNGKIFHKKSRGKVYGSPFYVGQVIGIELDMMPTPGMDLESKSKARTHVKGNSSSNNNVFELGKHGGIIKFYVDDEDLGIAFYDLDLDKEYSLACALSSDQYTLQLIE
mmetsp:Transcript_24728/g.21618  ORF Transcript_24728/g.21618 Transcript_24728/m.21618 type:complete len:512 (+) Transcript_24728:42-1577(+)